MFIYGFRKKGIDITIFIRFCLALFAKYGIIKGIGYLKSYLKNQRNLFRDLPNRYVRKRNLIFVVPDVPPIGSGTFIQYLIKDVEVLINGGKAPLLFGIVCISSSCPYKCSYCYNIKEHSKEQLLSAPVIFKTIEAFISQGVSNIYLSGGEPMLREEMLKEILTRYASASIGFWLITTGWNFDSKKAAMLKKMGLRGLMVSLDDMVPEKINAIKGKQAFENAVNAIKCASEAGLVVVADCVMSRFMLLKENFDSYCRFAASIGVNFINMYAPRKCDPNDDEIKPFLIEELLKAGQLARLNQTSTDSRHLPIAYSPDDFEAIRGCMGGKLFFYVSPEGHVKACPFMKTIIGNVNTHDLKDIIDKYSPESQSEKCLTNQMLREYQTLNSHT